MFAKYMKLKKYYLQQTNLDVGVFQNLMAPERHVY